MAPLPGAEFPPSWLSIMAKDPTATIESHTKLAKWVTACSLMSARLSCTSWRHGAKPSPGPDTPAAPPSPVGDNSSASPTGIYRDRASCSALTAVRAHPVPPSPWTSQVLSSPRFCAYSAPTRDGDSCMTKPSKRVSPYNPFFPLITQLKFTFR